MTQKYFISISQIFQILFTKYFKFFFQDIFNFLHKYFISLQKYCQVWVPGLSMVLSSQRLKVLSSQIWWRWRLSKKRDQSWLYNQNTPPTHPITFLSLYTVASGCYYLIVTDSLSFPSKVANIASLFMGHPVCA